MVWWSVRSHDKTADEGFDDHDQVPCKAYGKLKENCMDVDTSFDSTGGVQLNILSGGV